MSWTRQLSPLVLLVLFQLMVQALTQQAQVHTQTHTHSQTVTTTTHRTQPKYIYYVFTEHCFDTFFNKQDFFHFDCLKFTISKLVGYSIVVGATIIKVPQIVKIVQKKSTYGVSFNSVWIESVAQICFVAYNVYRGNPFSIYGQCAFMAVQMMIIHALYIVYDKEKRVIAAVSLLPIIAFFFISFYPQLGIFPKVIFENMVIFQAVIFAIARLAQIRQIHRLKSCGSVSLATYAISTAGNLARLMTAIIETSDDIKLIMVIGSALLLNGYVTLCFFIFKEPKQKTT